MFGASFLGRTIRLLMSRSPTWSLFCVNKGKLRRSRRFCEISVTEIAAGDAVDSLEVPSCYLLLIPGLNRDGGRRIEMPSWRELWFSRESICQGTSPTAWRLVLD